MSYKKIPNLFEQAREAQRVSQASAERQAFHDFTSKYWLTSRKSIRGDEFGLLATFLGGPVELAEIDGFPAGFQRTELSLDISRIRQSEFTWRLDSFGHALEIRRAVVVSDDELTGTIEYQSLLSDPQDPLRQLGGSALVALLEMTQDMTALATRLGANPTVPVSPFQAVA